MSRYHSYINSAREILCTYKGETPFSSFLKKSFSSNKKFGSRDRKTISHLCYCYFRLGRSAVSLTIDERILISLFVCSNNSNEILAALKPEWNEQVGLSLEKKLVIINYSSLITEIFPWRNELTNRIDHEKFCESFLIQPDVFIRLRPGKEKGVIEKLKKEKFDFEIILENCLAVPSASKLDDIIELDIEAVIQDVNSQRTGDFIKSEIRNQRSEIRSQEAFACRQLISDF